MTHVIGIDIGGTSIKGVVADRNGTLLTSLKLPTSASRGKAAILETLEQLIVQLKAGHPEVQAIGIGSAGRINTVTGEVVFATDNLPGWQGTNIKQTIEERFKLPAAVDNDANVALLGEVWLGAGQGLQSAVMITLGTGVGGANMVAGELQRGANWNGGEWGHVVLVPGGTACNCGRVGCVEQYLSGNSLTRIASTHTGRSYPDGYSFMNDVTNGDAKATSVMEQYLEHLTVFLGNLQLGIDPEAFIIGGGIIDSSANWWHQLEEKLGAFVQNGTKVHIRKAELGNTAGCYGAAKLAIDLLEQN